MEVPLLHVDDKSRPLLLRREKQRVEGRARRSTLPDMVQRIEPRRERRKLEGNIRPWKRTEVARIDQRPLGPFPGLGERVSMSRE